MTPRPCPSPVRVVPAIAALLALAACGSKGSLAWPDGTPPPKPLGAEQQATINDMLAPPPQAAPDRLDDPVKNADVRGEDEFDLPPLR